LGGKKRREEGSRRSGYEAADGVLYCCNNFVKVSDDIDAADCCFVLNFEIAVCAGICAVSRQQKHLAG
jgi:hypothetical protein